MEPTLFREGTPYRRVETEGSYREQPLLFSSALHVNRLNWLFSISVNSETTKTFRMEATNSRRILLIVVVSYYRQSINAGKGLLCIIRTLVINLRQSATLHYRCWPPWRLYQVNKARSTHVKTSPATSWALVALDARWADARKNEILWKKMSSFFTNWRGEYSRQAYHHSQWN